MVRTFVRRFISDLIEVVSTEYLCVEYGQEGNSGRSLCFLSVDSRQIIVYFDLYRQVDTGDICALSVCAL